MEYRCGGVPRLGDRVWHPLVVDEGGVPGPPGVVEGIEDGWVLLVWPTVEGGPLWRPSERFPVSECFPVTDVAPSLPGWSWRLVPVLAVCVAVWALLLWWVL